MPKRQIGVGPPGGGGEGGRRWIGAGMRRRFRRRGLWDINPIPFKKFTWLDWLAFGITCFLIVYAIGRIIFTIVYFAHISNGSRKDQGHQLFEDIKKGLSKQGIVQTKLFLPVRTYLPVLLLITLFILLVTLLIVICWLKWIRNIPIFLLIFGFLILLILLYISVGCAAVGENAIRNKTYVEDEVFKVVQEELKHKYDDTFIFFRFQQTRQCCGIHGYKDYRFWKDLLQTPNQTVPDSCCKGSDVQQLECVRDAQKYPDNSDELLKKINKGGCAQYIGARVESFVPYWIEALILVLLLIFYLIVLILIGSRVYQKVSHPRWGGLGPREQEDDLESEIIPGTPAKSMISDDENTFYAP